MFHVHVHTHGDAHLHAQVDTHTSAMPTQAVRRPHAAPAKADIDRCMKVPWGKSETGVDVFAHMSVDTRAGVKVDMTCVEKCALTCVHSCVQA